MSYFGEIELWPGNISISDHEMSGKRYQIMWDDLHTKTSTKKTGGNCNLWDFAKGLYFVRDKTTINDAF